MTRAKKVKNEVIIKPTSQLVDEFYEQNPIPHTFKFFHRFTNYKYDFTLYSLKRPYQEKNRNYSEYSKSKILDYILHFANTESGVLRSHYSNMLNKKPLDQNTNPYPLAVRYMDYDNGVYIIERPPFQLEIDYSYKKNMMRKEIPALRGRKIWIPWTVSLVNLGTSVQSYNHRLFVSNGPLNSLDDTVMNPVLPNLFADSRICFGDSNLHLLQRIDRGEIQYNIANVFTYMFNEYFQSWNPDLWYQPAKAHGVLQEMGIFNKIKNMKVKKMPKNFDCFSSWNLSSGKFWFYFLYTMSFLSYEETIEFYQRLSTYSSDTNKLDERQKPIKLSELIKSENESLEEDLFTFTDELNMPGLIGYGTWDKILNTYSVPNEILRTEVNIKIDNIPEGCLINQDIVSNPNLIGFIYFKFVQKLTEEYMSFCKEKGLIVYHPENQMDSLLNYTKVHENNLNWNYHNSGTNSDLQNNFPHFLHRANAPLTSTPLVISVDYNDIISNVPLDSSDLLIEMETV